MLAFHKALDAPITFATRGVRAGDIARKIVGGLPHDYQVSTPARSAFAQNSLVADEMQGLSRGTVLAATLQPLGLAYAPRKRGKEVEIWIDAASEFEESWPIGWPPDDSPFKIAPSLFEYLNVEIKQVSAAKAVTAIQPRVEVPFLFDQVAMARYRIDLETVEVSFPKKRTFYKKILDNVFFQAHLTSKLRVDEAGRPFLWITSTRR